MTQRCPECDYESLSVDAMMNHSGQRHTHPRRLPATMLRRGDFDTEDSGPLRRVRFKPVEEEDEDW